MTENKDNKINELETKVEELANKVSKNEEIALEIEAEKPNEFDPEVDMVKSIVNFYFAAGRKTFAFLAYTYFNLINQTLEHVKSELNYLMEKQPSDEAKKTFLLTRAIAIMTENPELQKEWVLFIENLTNFLKPLIDSINDILNKQGKNFARTAKITSNTVSSSIVTGTTSGISAAVRLIPGLGTILSIASAMQSTLNAGTKISEAIVGPTGDLMLQILSLYDTELKKAELVSNSFNKLISQVQDQTIGDGKTDAVDAKKEVDKATEKLNTNQAGGFVNLNNITKKNKKLYRKNKKLKLKSAKNH